MKSLLEYFEDFTADLLGQLSKDHLRWGDTWQQRSREGQEDRIFDRIQDYRDQFNNGGRAVPWLKIAGLAFIGHVREKYVDAWPEEAEGGTVG